MMAGCCFVSRVKTKALLFVCLGNILAPSQAQAVDTIQWARLDFPPFEINNPPLANEGIVDLVRKEIENALKQYVHEDAGLVNQSRLEYLFKNKSICHAGLIRTPELESMTYMSLGIGIMPSHVLITTAENYKGKFHRRDQVSLSEIIDNKDLIMVVPARTMGQEIDSIVFSGKEQPNVYTRKATEMHGLFSMLIKKRFDYTIGYPAEALYWNRNFPDKQLAVIPLSETAGHYTIGRVACSKNEWGLAVVKEINRSLAAIRLSDHYVSRTFLQWVPENIQGKYLNDYREIISYDHWTNAQ